jgi:hypothetical protein
MKTAIIFYGFFRKFEVTKESLKQNVIDPLNTDVFFTTFETLDTKRDDAQDNSKLALVDNKIIDFFGDRLKKYELRPHQPNKDRQFLTENNLPTWTELCLQETYRIVSMQQSLTRSMKLFEKYVKDNNLYYDLVILTRPDIKYYTQFNPSMVDMNKVNCPEHFLMHYEDPHMRYIPPEQRSIRDIEIRKVKGGAGVFGFNRWLNDQILCGSQEKMLIYATLSDRLIEYVRENICFNNETLIGAHLIKNGIEFGPSNFVTYELWR